MSLRLEEQLNLERCPHCNIAKPNLAKVWFTHTQTYNRGNPRHWKVYCCSTCGGLVTASSADDSGDVGVIFPSSIVVDNNIPSPAKEYLQQAIDSINAPSGAIMLAASSVDAMLKNKGYKEGKLYTRINQAAKDNLITKEMADWAHEVRLDANDERHSDEGKPLPNEKDAKHSVDFALALGAFLFTLPAKVKRGLEDVKGKDSPKA